MLVAMQNKNDDDAERSELRTVRQLLLDWTRWRRRWRPKLGYPGAVPYLDGIRGTIDGYTEGEDYDERIEAVTMRALDMAIESDLNVQQRAAIMVRYLNEIGPAVWRSNRVPKEQVRRLADEAELALVPALRKRNVRL